MTALEALHNAAVTANKTFRQHKEEMADLRASFWASLDEMELITDGVEDREQVILSFKKCYPKLGAPGDFGYGTPCGDALKAMYDRYSEFVKAS